jgi:Family of unknown function (DUF5519)
MHKGGVVDIPFPRAVRNALLAAGLAEQHHWVPNSGWTTFRIRSERNSGILHAGLILKKERATAVNRGSGEQATTLRMLT